MSDILSSMTEEKWDPCAFWRTFQQTQTQACTVPTGWRPSALSVGCWVTPWRTTWSAWPTKLNSSSADRRVKTSTNTQILRWALHRNSFWGGRHSSRPTACWFYSRLSPAANFRSFKRGKMICNKNLQFFDKLQRWWKIIYASLKLLLRYFCFFLTIYTWNFNTVWIKHYISTQKKQFHILEKELFEV